MSGSHGTGTRANTRRSGNALPLDRFDRLPQTGRVGAHRIIGRPRRFGIYLIIAILGVAVLTALGILWVHATGANLNTLNAQQELPAENGSKQSQAVAEIDSEATVVVLNGTTLSGFGGVVDGIITENGWGTILFSGDAVANDVQTSAVLYEADEDQPAALALAAELGGVGAFQNSEFASYGARLVVMLGADYGGPGSEQLVAGELATPTTPPREFEGEPGEDGVDAESGEGDAGGQTDSFDLDISEEDAAASEFDEFEAAEFDAADSDVADSDITDA